MNDVLSFLNFTSEIHEDFEDNKLPSLDTNIWVEDLRILFEHFEKPMNTNLVVQARSAISDETKASSLAEEVARRLRNTSRKIPHGRRLEILEDLFTKMKTSGHSDKFMRNVAIKGIISYENKVRRSLLDKSNPAYLPLYMGSYNSRGRAKVKAQKKTNWFRSSETETGSSRYPAMKKSKLGTKGRKSFKKAGRRKKEEEKATTIQCNLCPKHQERDTNRKVERK